jgi:hypothetical protein
VFFTINPLLSRHLSSFAEEICDRIHIPGHLAATLPLGNRGASLKLPPYLTSSLGRLDSTLLFHTRHIRSIAV